MPRWVRLLPVLWLLAPVACGYRLVQPGRAIPGVQRVAIPGFENNTFEPYVDQIMTDAIYREFLRRGSLRLVDDPAAADLVIEGVVEELRIVGRSFSSIAFSLEFEVEILLDVEVVRPDGTLYEIDPRATSGRELYLASADIEVSRRNREEAIRRISASLAGRIHDALFERMLP